MSDPYYETTVLIPADVDLTFENVIDKFQYEFLWMKRSATIDLYENVLWLDYNGWRMWISWENDANVLEQSVQIAEYYAAERSDADRIAQCDRRISVGADPDPDGGYLEDYVSALTVLSSIAGCFLFDPNEGSFIELNR